MARPIEATPIIRGKYARQLLKEMEKPIVITAAKQKEWDKFRKLYEDMMNRRVKHGANESETKRNKQKPKRET